MTQQALKVSRAFKNVKVGHYAEVDEGRDVEKTGRGRHAGTSSTGAMPLRAAQMMGQQGKKNNKKIEVRGKCHDCPGKYDSRIKPQMMGQQEGKEKKKKSNVGGSATTALANMTAELSPPGLHHDKQSGGGPTMHRVALCKGNVRHGCGTHLVRSSITSCPS